MQRNSFSNPSGTPRCFGTPRRAVRLMVTDGHLLTSPTAATLDASAAASLNGSCSNDVEVADLTDANAQRTSTTCEPTTIVTCDENVQPLLGRSRPTTAGIKRVSHSPLSDRGTKQSRTDVASEVLLERLPRTVETSSSLVYHEGAESSELADDVKEELDSSADCTDIGASEWVTVDATQSTLDSSSGENDDRALNNAVFAKSITSRKVLCTSGDSEPGAGVANMTIKSILETRLANAGGSSASRDSRVSNQSSWPVTEQQACANHAVTKPTTRPTNFVAKIHTNSSTIPVSRITTVCSLAGLQTKRNAANGTYPNSSSGVKTAVSAIVLRSVLPADNTETSESVLCSTAERLLSQQQTLQSSSQSPASSTVVLLRAKVPSEDGFEEDSYSVCEDAGELNKLFWESVEEEQYMSRKLRRQRNKAIRLEKKVDGLWKTVHSLKRQIAEFTYCENCRFWADVTM